MITLITLWMECEFDKAWTDIYICTGLLDFVGMVLTACIWEVIVK